MRILAIETSCDETSAAVVEKREDSVFVSVLSNIVASSMQMHAATGGIIPEQAAREQVRFILPTLTQALESAFPDNKESVQNILQNQIDAIAVTNGPGLIGSLLVGVETAKTLALVFNKPIIPVHHLLAHIYANFIADNNQKEPITFPFIGLIVSGGHTDLLYFSSHDTFSWLGGTRDDAAGEALDKIGRSMELAYPAGPEIDKRAQKVQKTDIRFKSPLLHENTYDFSFSGLKTEVGRYIQKIEDLNETVLNGISYATQKAVVDVLVSKTIKAAEDKQVATILVGGGVSANSSLRQQMSTKAEERGIKVYFPQPKYSTDNAAVIGTYAAYHQQPVPWSSIKAEPELYFD